MVDSGAFTHTVSSNNGNTLTLGTIPADGVYSLKDANPQYYFGYMSYTAAGMNSGYGYVKYEFSVDGGTSWGVILDTENGIDRLASIQAISSQVSQAPFNPMYTGTTYKVRITLKNDISGFGPKVHRFLVATDPSPWRW